MSKEYVEREVISEGIRKYYYKNPPNSSYQEGFDHGLDKAQRVILNAPAADVVPVVRCQDCVYARPLFQSTLPTRGSDSGKVHLYAAFPRIC